jgi:methionine-rich copper-binding protein CopC
MAFVSTNDRKKDGGYPGPMLSRRTATLLISLIAVAIVAAPAGAHGVLHHADPAPDSRAKEVPTEVSAILTEAPVPSGKFVVTDGCDRKVNDSFDVDGVTVTAAIGDAQPGAWKVRFDFISKVDGHRYSEDYAFAVAGKRDCSPPEETEEPVSQDEPYDDSTGSGAGADEDQALPSDGDGNATSPASDEGSFPIVPLALGTVVLVGVAVLARRSVRG